MKRSTLQLVEAARRAERSLASFQDLGRMKPAEILKAAGDPAEAARLMRTAAAHGVVTAQSMFGQMLLDGHGVEADAAAARSWFSQAAHAGHAEAMNMLGRCFENGWGGAIDEDAAARWYRRSAEAGHAWGEYNHAHMLFDGRGGTIEDRAMAFAFYRRAAGQGHARAMNLVARCLEAGWGVDVDRAEAARWYEKSAEAGYFRAQFNHAGILLERGEIARAIEWLERAEQDGDAPMRAQVHAILAQVRERLAASLRACAPHSEPPRIV